MVVLEEDCVVPSLPGSSGESFNGVFEGGFLCAASSGVHHVPFLTSWGPKLNVTRVYSGGTHFNEQAASSTPDLAEKKSEFPCGGSKFGLVRTWMDDTYDTYECAAHIIPLSLSKKLHSGVREQVPKVAGTGFKICRELKKSHFSLVCAL